MSSISTNCFPPKKNGCKSKSLHHRRRRRSSRYRGHDGSGSLVSQNSKHFLLLIFYGSSSRVSRGVPACLQQGKEVESALMPLDVHKNCMRICIARLIEHLRQARWKATWNVFFWQRGWRRGQAKTKEQTYPIGVTPTPRPILSGRKHHSIQNYLRCKGLSWPCGFNITRENYPGESFHHRWMLHRRLNFFFLSFHWKGLSLRAKARLCDFESCTFQSWRYDKIFQWNGCFVTQNFGIVPEGSLEWTHKACSSSSIKTHLSQDICGHPFICAFHENAGDAIWELIIESPKDEVNIVPS